ncbi:MAG: hypothetical protein GXO22_05295 [Aquificae bacterium]|nr:hypothetical protein [Aquificota bacterium]
MQIRYYLILILLLFSLVWNLGIFPLYLEEPRRAVVALEMLLTGNFIVPTIMGELYFAKPPLFNWILILSAKLLNGFSELAVRLPTVVSVLFIGLFHYLISSNFLDKRIAFFSSLLFITSGTILFYFSLLGEIDIFYSFITYLSIVSIFWFFYKNQRLISVFPFVFASAGFLTKGFPSILFLYITLISFLFFERKLKLLFSIWHFIGIIIFLTTVGSYLYLYNQYAPVEDYLRFLWKESSQRTVMENPTFDFFFHIVNFPLKSLIALFPWSFLVIFLFRKELFSVFKDNRFLRFSMIAFVFNYSVYWISPGANQRYIYMLFPFLITLFVYMYFYSDSSFKRKLIKFVYFFLLIGLSGISFALLVIRYTRDVEYISFISLIFGLLFLVLAFRVWKKPIYYMAIGLIWFRILFDIVYLPIKAVSGNSFLEKKYGIVVADITKDNKLFYFGKDRLSYGLLFYIEREREDILKRDLRLEYCSFYLAKREFLDFKVLEILRFKTKDEYILFKKISNPSSYNPIKSTFPKVEASHGNI